MKRMPALMLVMVCLVFVVVGRTHAGDTVTFAQARPGYSWSFPDDHGSHPLYRTEWWYFTGVLRSSNRTYGYQFTIFRSATSISPRIGSTWHTNQVYMGHMALADLERGEHQSFVRLGRGHPQLAGADTTVPGRINVRDWRLKLDDKWSVQAGDADVSIDLTFESTRDPLFQGPGGYSRKGPAEGQASQYYSFTRMKTRGTIMTGRDTVSVHGQSWFDHEFGSSQLSGRQEGWDWFSLRLSDGSDLMIYRLREEDNRVTPQSSATLRRSGGSVRHIPAEDWSLEPVEYWTSPESGARYPVRWRIRFEDPSIELTVDRVFDGQEMVLRGGLTAPYWEGVVTANGSFEGREVTGEGFLEMTGYVSSLSGTF